MQTYVVMECRSFALFCFIYVLYAAGFISIIIIFKYVNIY